MNLYETFELQFKGEPPEGFEADAKISAVFTNNGESKEIYGFYDGEGRYKIRFYPRKTGVYSWEVKGEGLKGELSGSEECVNSGSHGMVKPNGLHFKYEDGTRFTPFGTTVYALVHQPKERVDETIETLRNNPFNKVRHCVFPKYYDYNHREPPFFPFEKKDGKFDVNYPCYEYWNELERRIKQLGEIGIQSDLILFHPYDHWGFSKLSKEECFVYLDYLTRRLSAYPYVWWSLANEYDLMGDFERERWTEISEFVHSHDPYGHLLSNHQCIELWDFSDKNTTHCCIQDSDMTQIPEFQTEYGKPVIFDECCYEGNIPFHWGNISAFELVHRFWMAYALGGYCTHGETFWNEDEILWWAAGGKLYGESPERIAFLKRIIDELPGDLTPKNKYVKKEDKPKISENPQENLFAELLSHIPEYKLRDFMRPMFEFTGQCEDNKAILYYCGRHCLKWLDIKLPEGNYNIEVIDVWEMTRKQVLENVYGDVKVPLLSKEGMAVLAKKV